LKQLKRSQERGFVLLVLVPRGNRDQLGAIDDIDRRDDSAAGCERRGGNGDGFPTRRCRAQLEAPALEELNSDEIRTALPGRQPSVCSASL
jgi:hypothetical protein